MMSQHRHLIVLLSALLLAACQSGVRPTGEGNLFRSLHGGELVLHQHINIRAGWAHTGFQDGVMAYGYSEYAPHCELQVAVISEESQTIPAGTYRIGRVVGITHYVNRPESGILLAGAGDFDLRADTTSEWYMFAYHMSLESSAAPAGLTLICGGAYNYPFYVRYPTLEEMRRSLGSYATLNPS